MRMYVTVESQTQNELSVKNNSNAEQRDCLIVELELTFLKRPSHRTLVNTDLRDCLMVELELSFVKRPLKELAELDVSLIVELEYTFQSDRQTELLYMRNYVTV